MEFPSVSLIRMEVFQFTALFGGNTCNTLWYFNLMIYYTVLFVCVDHSLTYYIHHLHYQCPTKISSGHLSPDWKDIMAMHQKLLERLEA